jgi:hypothetical protein
MMSHFFYRALSEAEEFFHSHIECYSLSAFELELCQQQLARAKSEKLDAQERANALDSLTYIINKTWR